MLDILNPTNMKNQIRPDGHVKYPSSYIVTEKLLMFYKACADTSIDNCPTVLLVFTTAIL
jgi:hypothetical protein